VDSSLGWSTVTMVRQVNRRMNSLSPTDILRHLMLCFVQINSFAISVSLGSIRSWVMSPDGEPMDDDSLIVVPKRNKLVVAVLWLCLLYMLSVGPAYYIARETGAGKRWVRTIYAPLFWLQDKTSVDTPLGWYSDKWEKAPH
jgi:hypothetical protein